MRGRNLLEAAPRRGQSVESVLDCYSATRCLINLNIKNVSVTIAADCGAVAGVLSVGLTKVFKLIGCYGGKPRPQTCYSAPNICLPRPICTEDWGL